MPFCSDCGYEMESSARFCRNCGTALATEGEVRRAAQVPLGIPQTLPYHISLTRVLFLSVISYGIYLFYWFYLTWKQYRDHTQTQGFPVWHALTLFVPIYGLFRTHGHMRSFKELMLQAGFLSTISAGWAVVLVLISSSIDSASFQVTGDLQALKRYRKNPQQFY